MAEQSCMTCRWYDRWLGVCFCDNAGLCGSVTSLSGITAACCRMWEARGQ